MTTAMNASGPNAGDWWGAVIQDSLYGRQAFHSAKISVQQRVHCRSCPTVWRESVIGRLHVIQSKDLRKLLRIFRACGEFWRKGCRFPHNFTVVYCPLLTCKICPWDKAKLLDFPFTVVYCPLLQSMSAA